MKRKPQLLFVCILLLLSGTTLDARSFISRQGYEFPPNEISLSYGRVSYPEIALTIGGALGAGLSLGTATPSRMISTGAISLEYQRYVHSVVAVGAVASYEHYIMRFDKREGTDADGNPVYTEGETQHHNVLGVMPSLKLLWFNRPHFSMYSKVAAGLLLVVNDKTSPSVAFQLSPVCADFGGRLCRGFVDLGFGCQGMVAAGVRFNF